MFSTKTTRYQQLPTAQSQTNGEGGIRTRGTVLPVRRFSKAVLSTTQPPLPVGLPRTDRRSGVGFANRNLTLSCRRGKRIGPALPAAGGSGRAGRAYHTGILPGVPHVRVRPCHHPPRRLCRRAAVGPPGGTRPVPGRPRRELGERLEVAAEVLTETAGRVCYMSFAKPRPGRQRGLPRPHQGSRPRLGARTRRVEPAHHRRVAVADARTRPPPRRHRLLASFRSGTSMSRSPSTSSRTIIADDPELHALWLEAVQHAHAAYVQAGRRSWRRRSRPIRTRRICPRPTARKTARQAARSVLPNATETKIFVTANARALRHFLEQRGSRHAEPEIRMLANEVCKITATGSPESVRRLPARAAAGRNCRGDDRVS